MVSNANLIQPNPETIVLLYLQWLYVEYENQKPGYFSPDIYIEKPSSHQEYISVTKKQKSNLSDYRDGFITVESYSLLIIRYGHVEFKTPDHVEVHDLPPNEKGHTS